MSWTGKEWKPKVKEQLSECTGNSCMGLLVLYERVAWLRWLSMGQLTILSYVAGRLAGFW